VSLHRLSLRQINENPTLMSNEVFVPAEEVDELIDDNLSLGLRVKRLEAQAQTDALYLADVQSELRMANHKLEELQWCMDELFALRSKLRMARACMEASDPLNARTIFGPPIEGASHEQTQEQGQGTAQQERTNGDVAAGDTGVDDAPQADGVPRG
jgi:hypothetical protein